MRRVGLRTKCAALMLASLFTLVPILLGCAWWYSRWQAARDAQSVRQHQAVGRLQRPASTPHRDRPNPSEGLTRRRESHHPISPGVVPCASRTPAAALPPIPACLSFTPYCGGVQASQLASPPVAFSAEPDWRDPSQRWLKPPEFPPLLSTLPPMPIFLIIYLKKFLVYYLITTRQFDSLLF